MAYDLTDQEIDRVIRALDAAPHGNKGAVLQEWAQRLSPDPDDPMSKQTLRRHIRRRRGKAKDAPGRPKKIPEKLFGGRSVACDFVDLAQKGFFAHPVAPLQGSFRHLFAASPTVSRLNINPPNSFSAIKMTAQCRSGSGSVG